MKLSEKKNLALCLSGGGVKAAAFHVGVCLALREKGFSFAGGSKDEVADKYTADKLTFKTYVGSSAGSVISTFLAAGFSLDDIIGAFTDGEGFSNVAKPSPDFVSRLKPITYRDIFRVNLNVANPTRLLNRLLKKKPVLSGGLEVLLKRGFKVNGLFTTSSLESYLRENVVTDNTFDSLGVNLYIIATQLNHSRKVIFGAFDETTKDKQVKYAGYSTISKAVAASASLPPFYAPYGIHNEKGKEIMFFDGEIRDTLSTHVAADHGCDLVIASYSIQPYHYNSEMGSLHEYGIPLICNQALYQVVQQKIDKHIQHQSDIRSLYNTVNGYLKQADIDDVHREKLLNILMERTNYKPNVDYIYIHPSPNDYEMFFADHFSLNAEILSNIVRVGFKSAMSILRQYNV